MQVIALPMDVPFLQTNGNHNSIWTEALSGGSHWAPLYTVKRSPPALQISFYFHVLISQKTTHWVEGKQENATDHWGLGSGLPWSQIKLETTESRYWVCKPCLACQISGFCMHQPSSALMLPWMVTRHICRIRTTQGRRSGEWLQ